MGGGGGGQGQYVQHSSNGLPSPRCSYTIPHLDWGPAWVSVWGACVWVYVLNVCVCVCVCVCEHVCNWIFCQKIDYPTKRKYMWHLFAFLPSLCNAVIALHPIHFEVRWLPWPDIERLLAALLVYCICNFLMRKNALWIYLSKLWR